MAPEGASPQKPEPVAHPGTKEISEGEKTFPELLLLHLPPHTYLVRPSQRGTMGASPAVLGVCLTEGHGTPGTALQVTNNLTESRQPLLGVFCRFSPTWHFLPCLLLPLLCINSLFRQSSSTIARDLRVSPCNSSHLPRYFYFESQRTRTFIEAGARKAREA